MNMSRFRCALNVKAAAISVGKIAQHNTLKSISHVLFHLLVTIRGTPLLGRRLTTAGLFWCLDLRCPCDCGCAVDEACAEDNVRIVEHALLQGDDDELSKREIFFNHAANVLGVI